MSQKCDTGEMSETDCKIIEAQIERRKKFREIFLKMRTDPSQHAQEAGYVFDPAIQKFYSMKVTSFDHFQPNKNTIMWGLIMVVPMFVYGYCVWKQRDDREKLFRTGQIKYRDRLFKFI